MFSKFEPAILSPNLDLSCSTNAGPAIGNSHP
jgi:hypothetical protein